MARERLSLKPRAAPVAEKVQPPAETWEQPAEAPVFDPERLAVQTYSAEGGMGFIQGKNFFTSTGKFIREAAQSQWYITTPEQEENNRKARARHRHMITSKAVAAYSAATLPKKLVQAARENAVASAAEALAE